MGRAVFAIVICWGVCAFVAEGAVTVVPSVPAIAKGGSVTFTVSIVPDTYVQLVRLSYEGESGWDQTGSAPFVFSHQFNSPMSGLTVTATVTYSNGDPEEIATTDIDVVAITLTGPASPLRGWPSTYTARSNPIGKAVAQFDWSYETTSATNSFTDFNTDGDDKSTWAGAMVVGGAMRCTATIGGAQTETSLTVAPGPRNWITPITCAQDNETWGDLPYPEIILSDNRDRDSNMQDYVFVPRNVTNFRPAWTLGTISSGPCAGWCYVQSTVLKCQRETVINQYAKSGTLGGLSFADANTYCLFPTPGDFIQALKNHEYRGTPDTYKSPEGHQGRAEQIIRDFGYDPRQAIEGLTDTSSASLEAWVDNVIQSIELDVLSYLQDETYMEWYAPNWGGGEGSLGYGLNARWDGFAWTECGYGPQGF